MKTKLVAALSLLLVAQQLTGKHKSNHFIKAIRSTHHQDVSSACYHSRWGEQMTHSLSMCTVFCYIFIQRWISFLQQPLPYLCQRGVLSLHQHLTADYHQQLQPLWWCKIATATASGSRTAGTSWTPGTSRPSGPQGSAGLHGRDGLQGPLGPLGMKGEREIEEHSYEGLLDYKVGSS